MIENLPSEINCMRRLLENPSFFIRVLVGKQIMAKFVLSSPFSSFASRVGLLRTQGGVAFVSGLNRVKSIVDICKG